MLWLIVLILSYFFLAIVSLFDRYFLVGPMPSPFAYTFYNGILGLLVSPFLIPFGIFFEDLKILIFGLACGLFRIFAILFLTKSIFESEISRAVPAIGGLLPIFSFFLFSIFLPQPEAFKPFSLLAFSLLLFGSVLVSLEEFSFKIFNFKVLKYPAIAAILFAIHYFLIKILFLKINFLKGIFLILIGGGIGAITLFIEKRKEILAQKIGPRISGIFISGQAMGGLGVFLQFYALFLARPYQVPFINALEGLRYVFLLFFVFLFSIWKPQILKEEIRGKILYRKILAILLIGGGLAILALK